MHLIAEKSVCIERPIEDVFGYVANMERFAEWFPGVLAIEATDEQAHGQAGKAYLETVAVPLRGQRKIRLVVREAEPNALFITEGKFPPLMPRMEVRLESDGCGACTLNWRMVSRNNGLVFRWTLLPLARRIMRKRAAAGLIRLKRNLEQP